ncbi:hypothetical protein F8R89_00200 [Streptomyces sp. SS1-1]|uniref:hypothetical protein n=1 Tax=Streptomyces sp. SS1-1 TaxID=2651869 RepID=UPI00124F82A3|nr:hypothetical protein [Streptomyces sp. SS1-1]KAB2977530.1 hypothetical protein F8R89_00200 [Streptomyces sp. SS1-1]
MSAPHPALLRTRCDSPDQGASSRGTLGQALSTAERHVLGFETGTDPARLLDAFPEPVLTRLRRLKAEWDPHEVSNQNFNIPPTP